VQIAVVAVKSIFSISVLLTVELIYIVLHSPKAGGHRGDLALFLHHCTCELEDVPAELNANCKTQERT
jgi:hypothetical protein